MATQKLIKLALRKGYFTFQTFIKFLVLITKKTVSELRDSHTETYGSRLGTVVRIVSIV